MALTYAHSDGRAEFDRKDLVEAMTTIESGTAVGVNYIEDESRAVAIHEAGHAVASHVYMQDVLSTRLSIRMRGGSLGHHQAIEKEERFSSWRHEEVGNLVWTLGAMAAEHVFYGENSTGVGGDVQSATWRASRMVGHERHGPRAARPARARTQGAPARGREGAHGALRAHRPADHEPRPAGSAMDSDPHRLGARRPGQAQRGGPDPRPGLPHRRVLHARQPRGGGAASPTRSSSTRSSTATRSSSCCSSPTRARPRSTCSTRTSGPRYERERRQRPASTALGSGGHAAQARSDVAPAAGERAAAAARRRRRRVRRRSTKTAATCCPSATARRGAPAVAAAAQLRLRAALPVPDRRAGRRRHRRARRPRRGDRRHPADKHEGPPWSPWKPTTGGIAGAAQIASHVAPNYRDHGVQLVKVDANDLSYKGVPLLGRAAHVGRRGRRHPGPRREGRPLPALRPGADLRDRPRQADGRARLPACAARRSSSRSTRSAISTSSRSSCSSRRRPARCRPSPCTSGATTCAPSSPGR